MRRVIVGLVLWSIPMAIASAQAARSPLPPGATLPVLLEHNLDVKHTKVGDTVQARLSQRVPLGDRYYLPPTTELLGVVKAVSATGISILWTQLRLKHGLEPVTVKLVAAADWLDVGHTKDPLGGPTHSTSDWVTEQIGGDQIYGINVPARVYNQYSEPVGRADGTGVYAPPTEPGLPDRAMGPFSTSSKGLYDLTGVALVSPGGTGPIVLSMKDAKWKLRAGSALLLVVVAQ